METTPKRKKNQNKTGNVIQAGLNAPVQHGKETLKKSFAVLSQAFVHVLNVASVVKLVKKKNIGYLVQTHKFTNACQRVGSWVIDMNILLQSLLQYLLP